MFDISFHEDKLPQKGFLVVPVYADALFSPSIKKVDNVLGGAVQRAFDIESFKGKVGSFCQILSPNQDYEAVLFAGMGEKESLTADRVQEVGARIASKTLAHKEIAIFAAELPSDLVVFAALGVVFGAYHFDKYHMKMDEAKKPKLQNCAIYCPDHQKVAEEWPSYKAVAEGVTFTRNLVTEPSNVLFPAEFVRRLKKLTQYGIEVDVLDTKKMQELGFGALLGVAQGSEHEPYTVVLRYNGGQKGEAPFAFVGKGVTFDTGGISLKPSSGMAEMKEDMGGAGVVSGVLLSLAQRKAPVNAVGVVGLVENMPSGSAQRPGDVVKSASGQTIEVLNTDAEGRLVLADILWYAKEKFSPRLIVDLATLTGAMVVSLGHEFAGVFSNDDRLASSLEDAGQFTGERLWRFPMAKEYDELLDSDIADMQNISSTRGAGSITAAQFLQRFIGDTPWAHLDIAGVAWRKNARKGQPKGASGFGVTLLDRLVRQLS